MLIGTLYLAPRITKTCKREDCENTFPSYASQNKKFCSPQCRYSDPKIAQTMQELITSRHILSDIDSTLCTAVCAVCGVVPVRRRTEPKKHSKSVSWRCRLAEKGRSWAQEYGLSVADIDNLLLSQNNCCAICSKPFSNGWKYNNFDVDHCHETGEVRGLLCTKCNTGIGLLEDNIPTLESAIKYLSRFRHLDKVAKPLSVC